MHTVYSVKSTSWHGQLLLKEQLTQKWKVSHYLLHPNTWKVKWSVVDNEKTFSFSITLHYMRLKEPILFLFLILKRVLIHFGYLGECSNAALQWSSRNVLRTTKLHLTFHLHEDEENILNFGWAFPLKESLSAVKKRNVCWIKCSMFSSCLNTCTRSMVNLKINVVWLWHCETEVL